MLGDDSATYRHDDAADYAAKKNGLFHEPGQIFAPSCCNAGPRKGARHDDESMYCQPRYSLLGFSSATAAYTEHSLHMWRGIRRLSMRHFIYFRFMLARKASAVYKARQL